MELFTTERLVVRRLNMDDADAMLTIYGDREAMRFVGDARPLELEHCRHWVEVTDKNFEKRGYGMAAVIEKETGDLVGCIGVVHPGQQEEPELKYALRRDKWGQGLATEVALAMVDYARQTLRKSFIQATVYTDHVRSQAVLRKAGFHHEKDQTNEDGSVMQVWRIDLTSQSIS